MKHKLHVRLIVWISLTLAAAAQDRPNILFIMSDDHTAHALGAYGGRLAVLDATPNLDRLAELLSRNGGIRWERLGIDIEQVQ